MVQYVGESYCADIHANGTINEGTSYPEISTFLPVLYVGAVLLGFAMAQPTSKVRMYTYSVLDLQTYFRPKVFKRNKTRTIDLKQVLKYNYYTSNFTLYYSF